MPGEHQRVRRRRVLIVDDDYGVRRLLERELMDAGMDTACAANGAEAIPLLQAVLPDVIVLDLIMPVMDGRQFYRALRSSGWRTPVLLLSAVEGYLLDPGQDPTERMLKPFDPDQLVERVRVLCGVS